MAKNAQSDQLKRYLDAGVAFTQMTRDRAESIIKDLVKAGEIQRSQTEKWVEDLLDRSRKNTEQLLEVVRTEVERQIKALGLAPKAPAARKAPAAPAASKAAPEPASSPAGPAAPPASGPAAAPAKRAAAKKAAVRSVQSTASGGTKKAATAKKATPAKKAPAKKASATKKA